jgi:hypothetical protein
MRSISHCISAVVIMFIASPVNAGELVHMDWSVLIDQSVQDYDDPYRDLSQEQLINLVTVAQLREKAEQGISIDKEQLSSKTASLIADGIDVDDLIAQRWIVAERRERAAISGNKAIDGREIILSGFVIAAPADADGMSTAYLVPERGMCSHMHPPSPNQMVRLRLPNNWQPKAMYQPVQVSGVLSIDPTTRTVQVVDGPMPMHATFRMDVSNIETSGLSQTDEAPQPLPSGHSFNYVTTGN